MRVRGIPLPLPMTVVVAAVLCLLVLTARPSALGASARGSLPAGPEERARSSVAGPRPSPHRGAEFTGSRACRVCHLREYRSWQDTAHAKAFELLAPGVRPESKEQVNLQPGADYRANEACLPCHTVGYQQPGGFVSLEETPELVGVGCENCHGAGGEYIADDVMGRDNLDHSFEEVIAAGLIYPVPEATCRKCHGAPETPFNPELFPEYAIEYGRETLGAPTHEHPPLRRQHGPLPEGVLFQPEYGPGGAGEAAPSR